MVLPYSCWCVQLLCGHSMMWCHLCSQPGAAVSPELLSLRILVRYMLHHTSKQPQVQEQLDTQPCVNCLAVYCACEQPMSHITGALGLRPPLVAGNVVS